MKHPPEGSDRHGKTTEQAAHPLRAVGNQGADRPGHDPGRAGGGGGDLPAVSELHPERDTIGQAVH